MITFKDALLLIHLPIHPFSITSCPALRAARFLELFPAVFWGWTQGYALDKAQFIARPQRNKQPFWLKSFLVQLFFFSESHTLFFLLPRNKMLQWKSWNWHSGICLPLHLETLALALRSLMQPFLPPYVSSPELRSADVCVYHRCQTAYWLKARRRTLARKGGIASLATSRYWLPYASRNPISCWLLLMRSSPWQL